MKTKRCLLLVILLLGFGSAFSQSLTGRAFYKASNQIMIRIDSADMSPEEIAQAHEIMKKPWQRDFVLSFTQTESNWQQLPSMEQGTAPQSGEGMSVSLSGQEDDLLYKDLAQQSYIQEQEFMGRDFLIRDVLAVEDWQMGEETKQIGDYTAQKATYFKVIDSRRFSTGMAEMEAVKDTIRVTVWYTPEIPVAHGPENYFGLPGLILEVHNGGRSFYCEKIELNPSAEPVQIRVPKKGRTMDSGEFRAMQEESIRQLQGQYQGKPGGKNGRKVSIGG
ncbi:GLPGLI family protein [Algoriphagus sp. H41]|uniref:GLPGLI family protein n=1 Tax=Algoriphagus oliviformis TaxID=2811231 RepID=A0ABS3C356_9BACT|nr:GLPGLI family protein [Algoriphagus oliviformis]MBN7811553.1 GLPGLI family protein [Algoriphagus oliviformis]